MPGSEVLRFQLTGMDDVRIAELLAPFMAGRARGLSAEQLRLISIYINLLLRWNARINLTAVREPEEIVTRHFGESIFAARHLFPDPEGERGSAVVPSGRETARPRVIDVGSGAGFPGLPIKVWNPQIDLTLIEANQKKATFLREAIRSLGLAGVDVFGDRAEAFPKANGDVVTLRAVERFEASLPVAADLVSPGGRLAVLVGKTQVGRVSELVPGWKWSDAHAMPLSDKRILLIGYR